MVSDGIKTEVVLITGGCGFLAQHLIRELQTNEHQRIKEIRVADKKIYEKFMDYPDHIPILEHIVDCVSERELDPVVDGCTVVFNLCSAPYPLHMLEDRQHIWDNIVTATRVLISLMCKHNVDYLINVGDALSVCSSWDDCQAPSEASTLDPPNSHMMSIYGEAKFKAEKIVRDAGNGELLMQNGNPLRTVSVRPTLMYGEGDSLIIPYCYKLAKMNSGWLLRIGEGDNIMQVTYAGNVASILVQTWLLLLRQPAEFSGEVFYAAEGGVSTNLLDFIEPYMDLAGFSMSQWALPFELGTILVWCIEKVVRLLSRVGIETIGKEVPNATVVRCVGGLNFHFSNTKARLVLDWHPPYDREQAMKQSLKWWADNYKKYA